MSTKMILMLLVAATAIALISTVAPAMAATSGALKDVKTEKTAVEGETLLLEGSVKFETLGTGIECTTVAVELETLGAQSLLLTRFEPAIKSCSGFGSIYKGCKVKSFSALSLPYATWVNSNDLAVDGLLLEFFYQLEKCENAEVTFTDLFIPFGLTLTPVNTSGKTAAKGESIAGFEISGEVFAENNIGELAAKITGSLQIFSLDRCTYAFE